MLARLFLAAIVGSVAAEAAPVNFNIPAQRGDRAVAAFASQSGAQYLAASDPLSRVRSHEVGGEMEPAAAIAQLLEGTGFVARQTADGKYAISAIPAGTIVGRLVDESGRPIQNARVALDPPGPNGSVNTDRDGNFRFPGVPAGDYVVRASPSGFLRTAIRAVTVVAEQEIDLGSQTLLAVAPTMKMDPYIVQGMRAGMPGAQIDPAVPAVAAGNIDLRRTENDVLPFAVYGRDRIARSGAVTLNGYLQRELLEADPGTPAPSNANGEPSFSSSNLQLRGFNEEQTVILVNGRRLPEVLTNTGAGTPHLPDVNFIPLSLVQQVEVLPVSSSAIFAGNAVGGVINIVLRPGVKSATEVGVVYTNSTDGFDAPESSLSLMHSQVLLGGKARFRLNASFTETQPASERELGHLRRNLSLPDAIDIPLHRATPNIRSANGSDLFGPGSSPVTSVAPGADGSGGIAAFAGRAGTRSIALFDGPGGTSVSPDSIDYQYGRRQSSRSYYGTISYDLTPWLQLGLDASYGRTRINTGFNMLAGELTVPAAAPTNPFGQDVVVSLNEVPSALGESYSEAHVDVASVVGAAIVKLPADWRATFDIQYGRNQVELRGISQVPDRARLDEMVVAGRYNPFRDTQTNAPPAEFYDRVLVYRGPRGKFVPLGKYDTIDAAVRLANESIFLPTGPAKLNLGGDYQNNHLDPLLEQPVYGDGSPAGPLTRWSGRTIQRESIFAELQASLLPARWLPRWIESTETDIAGRYIFSDNAREANFAPTYGLKLGFGGGLSFRGSLTTSNRLPTPQLSRPTVVATGGGGGVSFTSIHDPRRNNEQYNIIESEAIDPKLRPEQAVTQTAGLIWEHGRINHIRLALDLADTRKTDELVAFDAQTVLFHEELFPDRVIRGGGDGSGVAPVQTVLTGNSNLAGRHSQNWTLSANYAWAEAGSGVLEVFARALYTSRYDIQLYPDVPVVDELKNPDGFAPNLLRYRANLGLGWSNRKYATGIEGRYYAAKILSPDRHAVQGSDRIDPYWQFDTYLQADIGRFLPWERLRQGLSAQLRVDNVLGNDFPRNAFEPAGSGVQPYGDWRGRTYSASVTASF